MAINSYRRASFWSCCACVIVEEVIPNKSRRNSSKIQLFWTNLIQFSYGISISGFTARFLGYRNYRRGLDGIFHRNPIRKENRQSIFAFNYIKAFDRGSHLVLTLQFLIGFRLAMIYLPMSEWFTFSTHISLSVVVKLVLWVALFAWMIIGKKKGMSTRKPER